MDSTAVQDPNKPHIAHSVDANNIPNELKALRFWAIWKLELNKQSNWGKVPYLPINDGNQKAHADEPMHRYPFDACMRVHRAGECDGIGIMCDQNVVALDLDNAFEDSGDLKVWAWRLVDHFKSYTERSPSGNGIRIIMYCTSALDNRDQDMPGGKVQFFSNNHFFTVTGANPVDWPSLVQDRTTELEQWHPTFFPPKVKPPVTATTGGGLNLSDSELLDEMFGNRKNGDKMRRLWDGDTSGYTSPSEADFALMGYLSSYTNKDAGRMKSMFANSGLYRADKADSAMDTTIKNAINGTTWVWLGKPASNVDPQMMADLKAMAEEELERRKAMQQSAGNTVNTSHTSAPTGGGQSQSAGTPGHAPQTVNYTNDDMKNSDTGNARRLVKRHGSIIRYVSEWNMWLIWNGKFWAEDKTLQIERLAKETVACIFNEAAIQSSAKDRDELWKFGILSEKHSNLRAMVQSARSEPGISIPYGMLNSEPFLLNVRNGIVDLRTGTLLDHDRDRLITKFVDIDFDPNANCPLWLGFLNKIQSGDADTIEFIQRAVGYTLTGTSREKMWLFMFGAKGNNGKSTFIEVIMALLGDYGVKLSMQTLLQSAFDSTRTRNDIADLVGARLVVASEIEQGRRLNESLMKDLTGGDTLRGNHLYEEGFNFRPTHALWMYGNYKPVIKGTDDAIWGRVRLIPFEVKIPDNEIDTGFGEKLKAELPGILAWAVAGCLKWQQSGLKPSTAVLGGTAQYRGDMDVIGRFLTDRCVLGDDPKTRKPYEMPLVTLYTEYQNWCIDEDEDELSKAKFGKELTARGIISVPGAGNMAMRRGIILRSTWAAQP